LSGCSGRIRPALWRRILRLLVTYFCLGGAALLWALFTSISPVDDLYNYY
jgi:hypothetical protein